MGKYTNRNKTQGDHMIPNWIKEDLKRVGYSLIRKMRDAEGGGGAMAPQF